VSQSDDTAGADRSDACTTTRSFDDHGVDDGASLVALTYFRLRERGVEFDPSPDFFDRLETAFERTYLTASGEASLPPHVEDARPHPRGVRRPTCGPTFSRGSTDRSRSSTAPTGTEPTRTTALGTPQEV